MEEIFPFLFILVVISIIVGSLIWSHFAEKKRTEQWKKQAIKLNFHFYGQNQSILDQLAAMKMFSKGHGRRAKNAITGDAGGIEITITDYQYTTGSGKNQTTHHQTLCILRADHLNLPHCYLRPEAAFFDFLGKLFGGQDINFDEDPAFSSAFVLQGEDERAIREVFTPETRAYFVDLKQKCLKGKLFFEAGGDTLMLHHGERLEPGAAEGLMQEGFEILQIFGANG